MANTSHNNQSHGSNSNSTFQAPVLMNNLTPFSMNLTQAASVKLDRDNFLFWKNVIMPIVRGRGLEDYLLGTKVCHPQFVNSQDATETGTTVEIIPNPEYSRWISVDQLLMGWLYASMTSEIVMRVMGCNNSSELWKAINENYGILNRSRVTFLPLNCRESEKDPCLWINISALSRNLLII
ncbi:Chitin-binding type-1 domain-containing protein [Abeliophyllum distichum]|uniref:Chitin-binding type-1 domain-containing protein n=1 Tax=Abeliophyllum distichum TaxID=126358 RepID=A0ABD1T0W3_9LAMI